METVASLTNALKGWINKIFGYGDSIIGTVTGGTSPNNKYIVAGVLMFIASMFIKLNIKVDTSKGKK